MSIVRFAFTPDGVPAGAERVTVSHRGAGFYSAAGADTPGPTGLWTWETHRGLCLSETEDNRYDDSDFYMLVWNPETGKAERICFASTRGWSYPSMASYVDATPEVRAAYAVAVARGQRQNDICRRWQDRARYRLMAAELQLGSAKAAKRLCDAFGCRPVREDDGSRAGHLSFAIAPAFDGHGYQRLVKICKLMKKALEGKVKSEFKVSLTAQVRDWLSDPAPKHASPLSPRQLEFV